MQFNLVVSTNTAGIRCWERNGFRIVGTLPGAFRHSQLGYVDALVMLQVLVEKGGLAGPAGREAATDVEGTATRRRHRAP
jgi:hypothetical protein